MQNENVEDFVQTSLRLSKWQWQALNQAEDLLSTGPCTPYCTGNTHSREVALLLAFLLLLVRNILQAMKKRHNVEISLSEPS